MEKFKHIKRICIIGGPGTGKTTLSNNLAKELNLPVYHIDGIHHLENWQIRDKEERDKIILNIVDEEKWIIDGTYKSTLAARIKSADIVIFLNYSKIARLKGILSRYFKNKGKEKPDIPGCREKMDLTFIKMTLNWNKGRVNMIENIIEANKNKEVYVFKNRRKLNKWYEEKFGKKIEV